MVVGHRGAPRHAPGNTFQALEIATSQGADALEIDVRATQDGVPVLHHDRTLDDDRLDSMTVEEARKAARREGFELATLAAVLERFDEMPLDVELKTGSIASDVVDLLLEHRAPRTFIVTSFHAGPLSSIRRLPERASTGLLLSPLRAMRLLHRRHRGRRIQRLTDQLGVDAVVVHKSFLRLGLLGAVLASDRPVLVWTVNNDRALRRVLGNPLVAGVITDRSARAVHLREAQRATTDPLPEPVGPADPRTA